MKGESGSPWWIPLVGDKVVDYEPLTKMEYKEEDLRERIHLV